MSRIMTDTSGAFVHWVDGASANSNYDRPVELLGCGHNKMTMTSRKQQANRAFIVSLLISAIVNTVVLGCIGVLWIQSLSSYPAEQHTRMIRLINTPVVCPPRLVRDIVAVPPARKPAPSVHKQVAEIVPVQPRPIPMVHHRFAYRRLVAELTPPSIRTLPNYVPSGNGQSGSQGNHSLNTAVNQAVQTSITARSAQAVEVADAQLPEPVAADVPVDTTTDPSAALTIAPPAQTPAAGKAGSSIASDSNGMGDGNGPHSNASAGTGIGSGTGSGVGLGNGTGSGAGTGNGVGSGGPFGVGNGGGPVAGIRHIVYLLDCSPSMTSRINKACQELRDALNTLQPEETFDIICFSGSDTLYKPELTAATPYALQQANYFLSTISLNPGTNLERVMNHALSIPGVNVVYLITDGVPTQGEQDFSRLAEKIDLANINHAKIFTVGLVGVNPDGSNDSFAASKLLTTIADQSGGQSKIVPCGTASPDDGND
jgi:hypothetical protein